MVEYHISTDNASIYVLGECSYKFYSIQIDSLGLYWMEDVELRKAVVQYCIM